MINTVDCYYLNMNFNALCLFHLPLFAVKKKNVYQLQNNFNESLSIE